MATDQVEPQYAEPRSGGCLKGCLIVFVILLVIAIIVGIFFAMYWRQITANVMTQLSTEAINASNFPEQEKQEAQVELKRLTDAFASEELSMEAFGNAFTALVTSPIMPTLVVGTVESHLERSGLANEEKEEGKVTIRRLQSAIMQNLLPNDTIDKILGHVATKGDQGETQPKASLTDEELQAFLADAKEAADAAEVPLDPEPIDLSQAIKDIVDSAFEIAAGAEPADDDLPDFEPSLEEAPAEPEAP